ncbi:MAG: DUF983 domain-containing protein [Pseudomonadota bacterium]|nr:DUF983 domain-containing protein [Pseudomonadota bacterium]
MSPNKSDAVWRGFMLKCPACGEGALLHHYLKVVDHCVHCGEDFSHQQADDAPPYFTILLVGHIIVPAMLTAEVIWHPAMWVDFAIWLPAIAILSLVLLPRIKGAVVGLQWTMGKHGLGAGTKPAIKP